MKRQPIKFSARFSPAEIVDPITSISIGRSKNPIAVKQLTNAKAFGQITEITQAGRLLVILKNGKTGNSFVPSNVQNSQFITAIVGIGYS
jgi:hypothetical protein